MDLQVSTYTDVCTGSLAVLEGGASQLPACALIELGVEGWACHGTGGESEDSGDLRELHFDGG